MARDRRSCTTLISRRAFLAGVATTPLVAALGACSHDSSRPRVAIAEPTAFARTRWANQPFARGATSFLPVGVLPGARDELARAIDATLFFAGEATSRAHPSTVRGAVESGRRAASEVLAAGAGTVTRVVVLGAGAAGLSAAAELRTAGLSPVVVEARDRIGGRVVTDASLGTAVDLGAGIVGGAVSGNPLVAIARQRAITLNALGDRVALHGHDGRSRSDAAALAAKLNDALARVGSSAQADGDLATALDSQLSLRDPERAYAISTVIEHDLGAAVADVSWRSFDERDRMGGDALPAGGMNALMAPLADGLDIRLRTIVQRVEWSRPRNRLVTDSGEVPFDIAVVTLPLGVLQSGTPVFDPPLPASTANAIARLGVGLIDKIALRFPAPFWERDAARIGFLGTTPDEWGSWLNLYPSTGQPILVGTNAALAARRFDARSDQQVAASAMSALRTMYA